MDLITINFEMIKIPNHTRESQPCSNNDTLCTQSLGRMSNTSGWGLGRAGLSRHTVEGEDGGPLAPCSRLFLSSPIHRQRLESACAINGHHPGWITDVFLCSWPLLCNTLNLTKI